MGPQISQSRESAARYFPSLAFDRGVDRQVTHGLILTRDAVAACRHFTEVERLVSPDRRRARRIAFAFVRSSTSRGARTIWSV